MKRVLFPLLLSFTLTGCHSEGGDASKPTSQAGASAETSAKGDSSGHEASVPSDAVHIDAANQPRAGIQVAPVTVRRLPLVIVVPAQVAMDERHTEHIGALADGRIQSVNVLPGDTVRRGQVLAVLHSHTVHETVAALMQAFAAVQQQQSAVTFATQNRDRYGKLYSIQAASLEEKQRSEQELAQANKDLADAQASMRAEREHLAELLQVEPDSLTPDNLYAGELVPVRAVSDGVVISRNITVGQVVSMGDEAFVISNLNTVWVNASVNERNVPDTHAGAHVAIHQDGGADDLTGTVTMLGDVLDPQTRTLPVRVQVTNRGMRLRPGMFVNAAISAGATREAVFVPADALQDVNGFRVIFVTKDGVTFFARPVQTGTQANGLVEVTNGLAPSDRVVVKGAFMVKGELLKGTVGEG